MIADAYSVHLHVHVGPKFIHTHVGLTEEC